jgi:hypothetical protein
MFGGARNRFAAVKENPAKDRQCIDRGGSDADFLK